MKKLLLSSAVIAFTVTSAFAQTAVTSEYYVVRDATTKKCTIVDTKSPPQRRRRWSTTACSRPRPKPKLA